MQQEIIFKGFEKRNDIVMLLFQENLSGGSAQHSLEVREYWRQREYWRWENTGGRETGRQVVQASKMKALKVKRSENEAE